MEAENQLLIDWEETKSVGMEELVAMVVVVADVVVAWVSWMRMRVLMILTSWGREKQ